MGEEDEKQIRFELARLRQEHSALDASQHRIAALEVEAAEEPISGLL
jgi:hypothetical protein